MRIRTKLNYILSNRAVQIAPKAPKELILAPPPLSPLLRKLARYAAAAGLTAAAGALLVLVPPVRQTPFLFFMGAVAVSAYYLGVGPSVLSTLMGAAITQYWHFQPRFDPGDAVRIVSFIAISLLIANIAAKRHRAERTAWERLQRFDTLANAIPELVWTSDSSGKCDYLSQRWADYTGTQTKRNLASAWLNAVHPDDIAGTVSEWERSVSSAQPFRTEFRLRRADGEYRLHLVSALPVKTGSSTTWIGTCTDIEDIKRRHQVLVQTEKLASAGRLAASIAHEINNPLEAALGALYLITSEEGVSPSVTDLANMADSELQRASQIVRQTLGTYRDAVLPKMTELGPIVEGVIRLHEKQASSKRVSIEPRIDKSGPAIVAVEGEIRQILTNLVGNAVDAVPEAGRVIVGVRYGRSGRGENIRIIVADTGAGIDPAHRQKIFEPFFTTKKTTGTGLGLWVTKQLVEKHGGDIRLRTGVGRGTVFVVSFPALRPATDALSA